MNRTFKSTSNHRFEDVKRSGNMNMSIYTCPLCKMAVPRESNKQWIKTYCEKMGKDTRLIIIKN